MQRFDLIDDLSPQALAAYDAIIDVRSPAEFAEDHVPGAINLPVLDDAERARVGTIYTQDSPFVARRLGAAIVSRNIAAHLETALADRPKRFRPLIYCWRGGMRSNAMATVLASVGWKVSVVEGGYRTWRRQVVAALTHSEDPLPVVLIDGQTGTAKTDVLRRMAERGEQVIDLEGLAAHRGSVFGGFADAEQPAQKAFETAIWDALRRFDLDRPVFVEAESSLVGRCRVPARLWAAMKAAPRVEIVAPAAARATYLVTAYPDMVADRDRVHAALDRLVDKHAKADIAEWRALAEAGDHQGLAAALIDAHYDPAYDRSRKRRPPAVSERVETDSLDAGAVDRLAAAIPGIAAGLPWR
ncbi:tRNA 2-selenouridine(34) synthase MnmH [Marinicauda salina]|uniref:tRNA 2-selenouridine(34) synthase MnmH n=1 Tax=Marinicauda salina TaxID=2135793 RepID=A0A2U2BT37_9PROT|nr:tRNA 2-selenouridine(34) synthase MnmH [Marinicauda salina]PWE17181.1 tRNA 2-selenouridine(34) synthase MnmH [Marinicauda salina]